MWKPILAVLSVAALSVAALFAMPCHAIGPVGGAGTGTIDTTGTPVANDVAIFSDTDTLQGYNESEFKTLFNMKPGTDYQAYDANLPTFPADPDADRVLWWDDAPTGELLWKDFSNAETDPDFAAWLTILDALSGPIIGDGAGNYSAWDYDYGDLINSPAIPTAASLSVDDLITLSGVAEGATHLGAFTGSTIADNQNNKQALQALETAVEATAGGHDAVSLDVNADTVLTLTDQEIGLDTQTANTVFAGPASGAATVPTFRALSADDIPDLSATYLESESNALETDGASGIADTEVFVGTGAGTGNYAAISGDATLANDGTLSLASNSVGDNEAAWTTGINVVIDGGGSEIADSTQVTVMVPYAMTITSATALADQSGSIQVDIWNDTYANYPPTDADSITASAPITISTATKSQDSTLTGWTTSISAGDILIFNVDSCTTIEKCTIAIKGTR